MQRSGHDRHPLLFSDRIYFTFQHMMCSSSPESGRRADAKDLFGPGKDMRCRRRTNIALDVLRSTLQHLSQLPPRIPVHSLECHPFHQNPEAAAAVRTSQAALTITCKRESTRRSGRGPRHSENSRNGPSEFVIAISRVKSTRRNSMLAWFWYI